MIKLIVFDLDGVLVDIKNINKIKWYRALFVTHKGNGSNFWNGIHIALLSKT